MSSLIKAFALLAVILTAGMSPKEQGALTVGCRPEGAKTVLPSHLCPIFADQVSQYTGRVTSVGGGDVVLVVSQISGSTIIARIDIAGRAGTEQAMARKDAPLDNAAFARFFGDLLQQSPALSRLMAKP